MNERDINIRSNYHLVDKKVPKVKLKNDCFIKKQRVE
jgi:hypothetical protein